MSIIIIFLQVRANDIDDGVDEDYDSSRDDISSVSSYNPTKENMYRGYGSSLSLRSSSARSLNRDALEGHRTSLSSNIALPRLSVAEVLSDSGAGKLNYAYNICVFIYETTLFLVGTWFWNCITSKSVHWCLFDSSHLLLLIHTLPINNSFSKQMPCQLRSHLPWSNRSSGSNFLQKMTQESPLHRKLEVSNLYHVSWCILFIFKMYLSVLDTNQQCSSFIFRLCIS